MNIDAHLFEQATKAIFEKTGFKVSRLANGPTDDNTIDIVIKDHKVTFVIEAKRYVAAYHVEQIAKANDLHHPIMVVAEQIARPAREQLRKKGIAYLEANGNAFIDQGYMTIFIDGNKPVKETKPVTNRAFTKTGLKAVFHLLNDTEAITRTYRQLAEETDVALGNIKYIMDGLYKAGFILPVDTRKVALNNKKTLLERWLTGYRETLKPDLFKGTYRMWANGKRENWRDIDVKAINAQWGGEAAAEIVTNYLQAAVLTVYTPAITGQVLNTLGLVRDDNGDVLLYDKFWLDQGETHDTTPPLLVYADLLLTDDPRCIETANIIYDKHLKERFETDETGTA